MTRHIVRTVVWTAVIALLVGVAGYAQDKISPVSDYQYKRDYAQYENIKKETDLQKKADALVAFMKEHPISRMLGYIQADYLATLKPLMDAKDWAKVAAAEEAFEKLMPTEKSVAAAQVPEPGAGEFIKNVLKPAQKTMQQSLMAAYFQGNNMAKAAEIAAEACRIVAF